MAPSPFSPCGTTDHVNRRTFLQAGLTGLAWLTPLSQYLSVAAEKNPSGQPAKSVILLWLAGGPSQLETFDPHPGKKIAYGSGAMATSMPDVKIGAGLPRTAEVLHHYALIRSMVSEEGDHERAFYNIKTGYRMIPALSHPSIGSVICHELPNPLVEIPTHISLVPNQWPGRGGYLGPAYDAFIVGDPAKPIQDLSSQVPKERQPGRLSSLELVERTFQRGRRPHLDESTTQHQANLLRALKMMSSDQLKAFDVNTVPEQDRLAYGDTPFGRGCLAAGRLIEAGVRCVEVTLNGWDTHANNHEGQAKQNLILDPALAALTKDLKARGLWDSTIVVCGGEFGRTPKLNGVDGRDHWPYGFSMLLGGGGLRGGQVLGATDPAGESKEPDRPVRVADLHATIQTALGVDPDKEIMTSIGRPMALSKGLAVESLLG